MKLQKRNNIFAEINNVMSKEKSATTSIGLGGLIFIVFLVLKLAEIGQVANWSWWWVTSPLWIPIAFILGIMGVIFLVAMITTMFSK